MGFVEVDWHTEKDLRRDGSIRPYNQKYSTIHGWVTKLRGTLSDNETVRREGIREMRAAKAVRQWKKKHAAAGQKRKAGSSGGGILSLFGFGSKKRNASKAVLSRDASRRSTKKGSTDVTLHFSHRPKPRRGHSTSSKVSGSITQIQQGCSSGKAQHPSFNSSMTTPGTISTLFHPPPPTFTAISLRHSHLFLYVYRYQQASHTHLADSGL
ncbi:hypothetical protein BC835DRAFT_1411878 [Cytidiella melzeri]|nr:hypothetical protein BC835DRAFT_1411878 [Cytidiella melzeri]